MELQLSAWRLGCPGRLCRFSDGLQMLGYAYRVDESTPHLKEEHMSSDEFDELRATLRAIKSAEERVRENANLSTLDCANVLDGIIRPAIRVTGKELASLNVQVSDGAEPFVRVPDAYTVELRYKCSGRTVEVARTFGGIPTPEEIPIERISLALITKQIDAFLKKALGIEAS